MTAPLGLPGSGAPAALDALGRRVPNRLKWGEGPNKLLGFGRSYI